MQSVILPWPNYQQANTQISYATITAPFDGQLNKIKLNVGSLVTPGTEIVTVTPRSQPYVIAHLKETQLKMSSRGSL